MILSSIAAELKRRSKDDFEFLPARGPVEQNRMFGFCLGLSEVNES